MQVNGLDLPCDILDEIYEFILSSVISGILSNTNIPLPFCQQWAAKYPSSVKWFLYQGHENNSL
jgi:hypothetical protein